MTNKSNSGCCSGTTGCCGNAEEIKIEKNKIIIDFLYLDLSVCERCQGTESNLDSALNELSAVLQAAGYQVEVNKINITSPELAVKYEFLSSPTIRVNGKDLAIKVTETVCKH